MGKVLEANGSGVLANIAEARYYTISGVRVLRNTMINTGEIPA